jgi:signal transduction histidine kinase
VASIKRVQYSGLVVAFFGFGITRLFVAEALQTDAALPFLIAGLLPLVVGLGLSVYGVALAIGPFDSEYVRTIARWHVLGVGSMVIVFAITALDQIIRGNMAFGREAPLLVANVLLGGAVGGTLTGIRTGRLDRQRRAIQRSANRALLVNRLLRHEVLNAVTIVDGHTDLLKETGGEQIESVTAIRAAVQRIRSTIDDVGTITKNGDWSKRIDIESVTLEEIRRIETEHDTEIGVSIRTADSDIAADERVAIVVQELLENAVGHGTDVAVELDGTPHTVELSVIDDGPGLPEPQRALLEADEFPEFDDPTAGFGHQIVRLLVRRFGGEIRVADAENEAGTKITVVFPRSDEQEVTTETVSLSFPNLQQAIVGGVLGGIGMGIFFQLSTGLLPVIGSLYGIPNPIVGWITHLFHSAVFGLLFAAICAEPRIDRYVSGPASAGGLGLAWGIVLWAIAAGVLMPAWLSLLGASAQLPNLSLAGLVGHALWGVILGITYWHVDLDVRDRLGLQS